MLQRDLLVNFSLSARRKLTVATGLLLTVAACTSPEAVTGTPASYSIETEDQTTQVSDTTQTSSSTAIEPSSAPLYETPSVTDLAISQAVDKATSTGFRVFVTDDASSGVVDWQVPSAGTLVATPVLVLGQSSDRSPPSYEYLFGFSNDEIEQFNLALRAEPGLVAIELDENGFVIAVERHAAQQASTIITQFGMPGRVELCELTKTQLEEDLEAVSAVLDGVHGTFGYGLGAQPCGANLLLCVPTITECEHTIDSVLHLLAAMPPSVTLNVRGEPLS